MTTNDPEAGIAERVKDFPRRNKDGSYHRADLKRVTVDQWVEWIQDDLKDPDAGEYAREPEPPYVGLVDAIQRLPDYHRGSAYNAVVASLDTAVDERRVGLETGYWTDARLDNLLLVAQEVNHSSFRDPILELLSIYEPHPERTPYDNSKLPSEWEYDIYGRGLDALMMIGGLPIAFWREQLAKAPGAYAAACFGGAGINSVEEACSLLPAIDWTDERAQGQMVAEFLLLLTAYGRDVVDDALEPYRTQLPPEAIKVIDDAFE